MSDHQLKQPEQPDLYKLLHVSSDANTTEIRKAYKRLSLVMHPDKNPVDPLATKRFQDLNNAYQILADPMLRLRYDLEQRPRLSCSLAAALSILRQDGLVGYGFSCFVRCWQV